MNGGTVVALRAHRDAIRRESTKVHKELDAAHAAVRECQRRLRDLSREEDELTEAIFNARNPKEETR